ncbi:hypothetical protein [Bacillus cereus]|uniref:hypothetical protein n=1 Tax=Bacillus cereus TaxID=1396 RepID=UPI0015CF7F33|nr:hypothetical protein [Bacillus cereus]
MVKDWTTLELVEFLNSYNRVFNTNKQEVLKYQYLYVEAFAELSMRAPLMSLLY